MISARRRSRQLAMNRISVAMNSRNSVKVGDRNSSVGCTQSNFGIWKRRDSVSGPPSMLCNSCQSASGRSNTCSLSFSRAPSSGSRVLHSISGEEIRPTMKHRGGADRGHDQDRADGAGNAVALEEARGRRQHGADHEGHHDRQEERLGEIEARRRRDDEQGRPAQRRRLPRAGSPAAVRWGCQALGSQRPRREADAHWEGHAPQFSPCKRANDNAAREAAPSDPNDCECNSHPRRKFHR